MSSSVTLPPDVLAQLGGLLGHADLAIEKWWVPILMLALALEGIPVLAILSPGVLLLVFAGFKATALSPLEALQLAVLCIAAITVGDLTGFLLGRIAKKLFPGSFNPYFFFTRELAMPTSRHFLLTYQFPPYARMMVPAVLGFVGYPLWKWLALSATASAIFVMVGFGFGFGAVHAGAGYLDGVGAFSNLVALISIAFLFLIFRLARKWFSLPREWWRT